VLYKLVADSIYTKKLCGRLSSSEVQFFTENGGVTNNDVTFSDVPAAFRN